MKFSIIIPVYNEKGTILDILEQVKGAPLPAAISEREIVIVDDCSKDGTRDILTEIRDPEIKVIYHEKNQGKGAGLRTGFKYATGDIIIVQDADLEYDPKEYSKLLQPILNGKADVVFGSRFIGGESHRILYFWHSLSNRTLTIFSNMFSDLNLSDMETCYKVFRKEIIDGIDIEENRFGFEPEITAKLGALVKKKGVRIYEVGISYYGRTYAEGKKIGLKDAFRALWCIFKYNNHGFASLVKYGLMGTLVALSQFLSMVILVELFKFSSASGEEAANIISIELATLVAFFLHSFITWRQKFRSWRVLFGKIIYFHFVNALTIAARIILFYLLANAGVDYQANTIVGIIIMIVLNFLAYDKLVFREARNHTRGHGVLETFLSKQRTRMACKLIPKRYRSGRILDIGCGSYPYFLSHIRFNEKHGIEKALPENSKAVNGIVLHELDIEKNPQLPFPDGHFDAVTMLASLEHFEPGKIPVILSEIRRVLKNDAIFVFTTPAKWTERILKIMSEFGLVSKEEISEHKDQYTRRKLAHLLTEAGFATKDIELGSFEAFMNIYGRARK